MQGFTSKQLISVVIADDHHLVTDMLSEMLASSGDFEVTTVGTFSELKQLCDSRNAHDLLLLDVNMPGMNGIESVSELIEEYPDRKLVIFSGNATSEFVRQSLTAGARGYLSKTISIRTLANALKLIHAGEVFVPSYFLNENIAPKTAKNDGAILSERELSVLRKVSSGLKNKEIAYILGLSEVTIKMHLRSICSKLHAKNRANACIVAKERGLI